MTSHSTTESFESELLPPVWKAVAGGAAELSERHRKDGWQSLQWTWGGGSRLRREGLALDMEKTPDVGIDGWVYLEKPLPGRLTFRLGTAAEMASGTPPYAFRFGLDFTGWRMFRVSFERDCRSTQAASRESRVASPNVIEILEIVPPSESPDGCVWLDALIIGAGVSPQRSADYQVPEHEADMGHWCAHWPLHFARQTPVEPLPDQITVAQQHDFATIFDRYSQWLLADNPDLEKPLLKRGVQQFQAYIRCGRDELDDLAVHWDEDGRIVGPGLVKDFGSPHSFKHVFYDILMPAVFDYKVNGKAEARRTVLDLFDYIHDQGWAEGSALGDLWLNCLGFAPYCHAVVLMRDELRATGRLETAVRAAFWYLTFGKSFSRFDEAYIETNADALRGIVFTSLVMILALDDTPRKVQYMRGWWNWYNDALKLSPRFTGLIKPDGLGFHHQGVYAGAYATEAYEFCSLIAWLLHGTEFAAAPESVDNLKLALKTQDTISNHYDVPYTTMGRMPRPGARIFSAYAYLALASEPPDPDLAGIFMRLWNPQCDYLKQGDRGTNYLHQVLSVDLDAQHGKFLFYQPFGRLQLLQKLAEAGFPPAPKPQGFFPKPWGALAIHRRGDWLVSVKGWSQYVWDFEMHSKSWAAVEENVFARYWSYGTLQPITHGEPRNPVDSGWNLEKGWDWCRWPGATTKYLTLAENYDPKTSWASRFFSSETFVGGVSCEGRNGMFALKLHEHYHDPSFRAFKTYFFFDNAVICLGSNIECRDEAHTLETTLFQCWMPQSDMPIRVDDETIDAFPWAFDGEAGRPLTLMDPYGNGYYLPDGDGLRLRRAVQHSRDAWNRGETEGAFSTAWLDHGHGPREDGYGGVRYHYAMLLQTTPEQLAAFADNPPYRVLQQNHQAHIMEVTSPPPAETQFPDPSHARCAQSPTRAGQPSEMQGCPGEASTAGCRTMAYALFETDWVVPHGIVRKTDTPVMVMVKEREGHSLVLSLADPDLRLPKRRNMGYLDDEANATLARPSRVRLELRGQLRLADRQASVRVVATTDETTCLEIDCAHGLTVETVLQP